MTKEIDFDHSSTTKPLPEVVDIVVRTMTEDYGNPSSMHRKGMEAEKYVKEARHTIASLLKVQDSEIIFTSGGTESNNHALIGTAVANGRRGKHILLTSMEHPAVSEAAKFLGKHGFTVEQIPVDGSGCLDLQALAHLLREDTILVSTMYVNNEIGAVVPVEEVADMVHAACPLALYHVDAIQAFGKYRIYPKQSGIDLMSVSGHKFRGPKGTGFLYIRSGAHIVPYIYGGGQQNAMRSGTENVPGIAGLGVAAAAAYADLDRDTEHLYALKERLEEGLRAMDGVIINSPKGRDGAPHIVNAAFTGVRSEVLLHTLEERGIYISAGSACSTHKKMASPTMTAIGAPKAVSSSSVRFSFGPENAAEEVDEVLSALREILPLLRRYRAR